MNFQDTCIYVRGFTLIYDDGFRLCGLKEGFVDCEFQGKWNECPEFKPVRQAFREIKEMK